MTDSNFFYKRIVLPNLDKLSFVADFIDEHGWQLQPNLPFYYSDNATPEHTPEIFNKLKEVFELEYDLKDALFFKFEPGIKTGIHIDTNDVRPYTMTIPIKNCDKLKVDWLKEKNPETTKLNPDIPTPFGIDPDDFNIVETIYMTDPIVMDASKWHEGINLSDEDAYLITVRFYKSVNALDVFK